MFPFDKPHNELVFENKNKMYGAYVIRREYDYSLKIAVLTAVGFVGLILIAGAIANKSKALPEVVPPTCPPRVVEIPFEIPKATIEEKKTSKPADTQKSSTNTLTSNTQATDEIQKDAKDQNLEAVPATQGPEVVSDSGSVVDNGPDPSSVYVKPLDEGPQLIAQEMPDVEGGILKYVSSHLRYPDVARENHTQGTVAISFVVEKDGSITNVKALNEKTVGDGCEEEAMRVIKSGKWKPGKNNGQAVRVQLTLPVRYKLQ